MQTATVILASAFQGIATRFTSKQEINANTLIMGVPAWTLVASSVLFAVWTTHTFHTLYKESNELKAQVAEQRQQNAEQKLQNAEQKLQNDELKRQFAELNARISDILYT